MSSEVTLKKSESLPPFLLELFKYVDSKDFDSVKKFCADDFTMYFAHYVFHGVDQGIGFVGAFDKRLPKYQHVMGDIFVSDTLITFDGVLKVWLKDGRAIETPFWDKLEIDPETKKIKKMYALFSIAAVPEEFWKDLKPEDFA